MVLTENERLLQNLTIENLDVHALHGDSLQIGFGHGNHDGGLYRLDLQTGGLLLEQTLNTHHDAVLCSHVFRQFLFILIIELTNETFDDPINVRTRLTLLQDQFILGKLHRHKDTLEQIQLVMSHCAVASG